MKSLRPLNKEKPPDGVPSGSWGYLSLGERLRPEDQPSELLSEHPQLVFRADFVELVDHPDQRADMVLGPLKALRAFLPVQPRIEGNGVRTIIVETASRFARDLMVQEVGRAMLSRSSGQWKNTRSRIPVLCSKPGVRIITTSGPTRGSAG
jgi:hypothetical protein